MGLLSTTDRVAQLQKKSNDAIGIFQNTIESLANTNAEIRAEKAKKIEAIEALQKQADQLSGMEDSNQNFIDKINNFLNS